MKLLTTVRQMVQAREAAPRPLGLVPTMGYLHAGHLALVKRAKEETAAVVVSIFVNPTQFGPTEDMATYPRDMERDLALLEQERVDIVFAPPVEEMYPAGYSTYVEVDGITSRLEGERRPEHFRGVATVVAKLFTIVRPDCSYFGQKDGQQLLVVRRLAQDLNLCTEVVAVPTVREPDGLALSSRNAYLSKQEREAALVLSRALRRVEELWRGGERDGEALRQEMRGMVQAEPLAELDYVSVADTAALEELGTVDRPAMASLAVRIGRARLIDNVPLVEETP
ncbi:MAG: pantoate--beta-alanine ligase [Chloroflexi bacterium]|nr:pantoate--beta-alanine ligase [Chloroflexota bacterium]